jgi:D-amino-acid dehydrogenase
MAAPGPASSKITVLGAGIVGIAVALALREEGHAVEVIDRLPPGEACSFGNSGGMPRGHAFPMAQPGIVWKVPGFLLDPLGPLAIRWSHLPALVPWLLRFVAASRERQFIAILDRLAALMRASHEAWSDLIPRAGLAALIREEGALTLYRTLEARERAWPDWLLLEKRGGDPRKLEGSALLEREPAVPRGYGFAVHEPDYRRTVDPYRLTLALAERFAALGGEIRRENVSEIEIAADGALALRTNHRFAPIKRLVIAAGAWSKRLAARFGHRVPLESARGYHVTFLDVPRLPNHALFISDLRLSLTPMANGLRVGGNVEFAGVDSPPDYRRPARQIENVRRLYPELAVERHTKWAGDRPMLPDSLPVIGPSPNNPKVVFAFGHGQYGLALAAGTARLVADLLGGRRPALDLSPFRVDRWR